MERRGRPNLLGLKRDRAPSTKMSSSDVAHCTVHFSQHSLLLPLWDATKSHSISRHAHSETLAEAALLTAVPINAHNGAGVTLQTFLVLNVLLNAATEKSLAAFAGMYTIVKSRGYITADFTQQDHSIQLCNVAGSFAW